MFLWFGKQTTTMATMATTTTMKKTNLEYDKGCTLEAEKM